MPKKTLKLKSIAQVEKCVYSLKVIEGICQKNEVCIPSNQDPNQWNLHPTFRDGVDEEIQSELYVALKSFRNTHEMGMGWLLKTYYDTYVELSPQPHFNQLLIYWTMNQKLIRDDVHQFLNSTEVPLFEQHILEYRTYSESNSIEIIIQNVSVHKRLLNFTYNSSSCIDCVIQPKQIDTTKSIDSSFHRVMEKCMFYFPSHEFWKAFTPAGTNSITSNYYAYYDALNCETLITTKDNINHQRARILINQLTVACYVLRKEGAFSVRIHCNTQGIISHVTAEILALYKSWFTHVSIYKSPMDHPSHDFTVFNCVCLGFKGLISRQKQFEALCALNTQVMSATGTLESIYEKLPQTVHATIRTPIENTMLRLYLPYASHFSQMMNHHQRLLCRATPTRRLFIQGEVAQRIQHLQHTFAYEYINAHYPVQPLLLTSKLSPNLRKDAHIVLVNIPGTGAQNVFNRLSQYSIAKRSTVNDVCFYNSKQRCHVYVHSYFGLEESQYPTYPNQLVIAIVSHPYIRFYQLMKMILESTSTDERNDHRLYKMKAIFQKFNVASCSDFFRLSPTIHEVLMNNFAFQQQVRYIAQSVNLTSRFITGISRNDEKWLNGFITEYLNIPHLFDSDYPFDPPLESIEHMVDKQVLLRHYQDDFRFMPVYGNRIKLSLDVHLCSLLHKPSSQSTDVNLSMFLLEFRSIRVSIYCIDPAKAHQRVHSPEIFSSIQHSTRIDRFGQLWRTS